MKRLSLIFFVMAAATISYAQIGYQVALLNTATGEARANEEVDVEVILKGADDKTIVSQKQTLVSNDLGLLSMTIGNEDTFMNVDWNNALPLSVTVYANDILVAQSQVLNVPVAEFAKAISPIDMNKVYGEWTAVSESKYSRYRFSIKISNSGISFSKIYEEKTSDGSWYPYEDEAKVYSGKIVGQTPNSIWADFGLHITFSYDYSTATMPYDLAGGSLTLYKK